MVYYYNIRIEYKKNDKSIIVDYVKDFCQIATFIIALEKKHKGNYTIIYIKPKLYKHMWHN